ncbi:MAG: methyl-accepting chemotaxis protein [Woeseiaceae bacterium]
MAQKPDRSSAFTILTATIAVLLLAAAGFSYLQSSAGGESGGARSEFAALSQAIPLHAGNALTGDMQGFVRLEADLKRLADLRGASALGIPGGSAAWDRLNQHAAAILEKRADVEAVQEASFFINERMPVMLGYANDLVDRSGAMAVIQEFQRRGARIVQSLTGLAGTEDPAAVAGSAADDAAYLRLVTNALSGTSTNLDVAALDDASREATLVPIISELTDIEEQLGRLVASAPQLAGLASARADLSTVAASLYDSAFSKSASDDGGILANPLIPLVSLGLALLLLVALAYVHSKTAVFERTSKEQAEQNERNQQAILRLLDELGSLADGDLTVEATVTEDITGAIADSINYAIEKLRELVATINETAIMVDSAAKQTESTAGHMARAAENQNREIKAATESIVSMAGSIEEVSGNAERSSDVARHSVDVAHKGGEAVRRTIDGMNAIRETIQETSKRIKRLGESSQEIGNIIELINDIAEQTNILALNASIQASMAGEAGRGFAVVADEVQRLAERSTNATKQIEVLVRTIQSDTNEAVVSMERSTTDVVGGALLAENAGAALDEIEQVSNQIANLVQNISSSARQQAGSAADVTRRTTKLKEISEQTGKATTATAAAISKLSELASQLRQTVAGFTLPSAALKASALTTTASPLPQSELEEKVAG